MHVSACFSIDFAITGSSVIQNYIYHFVLWTSVTFKCHMSGPRVLVVLTSVVEVRL